MRSCVLISTQFNIKKGKVIIIHAYSEFPKFASGFNNTLDKILLYLLNTVNKVINLEALKLDFLGLNTGPAT